MSKKPVLLDIEKLKDLVAKVNLGDDQLNEYINARWLNYVEWWDWRSRQAKRRYEALRCAVVIGSAMLPALVGLRALKQFGGHEWILDVLMIFVSLTVTISSGLESLFGFGDVWREKRKAAELIKSEGFGFLELAGAYERFNTHKEAYKQFAQKVEGLICHEIGDYIDAVTPKPPAGNTASSGASGANTGG